MPSRYEDELWRELVDKHGEEPEGEHPPAPPWRPRGPWAAAGGAALLAAAATGGVLAYSAISAPTPGVRGHPQPRRLGQDLPGPDVRRSRASTPG